jgi:hypothetical protein
MDEFGNYDRALSAADIEAICIEEHNGELLPLLITERSGMPFKRLTKLYFRLKNG